MTTKKPEAKKLYDALVAAGFKSNMAKMIVAQAAHETGNFTSQLFTDFNNPWGMKYPSGRKNTAKGSHYGYATYENLSEATNDYRLYWKCFKYPEAFKTVCDFIGALKKEGYFEDLLILYKLAVTNFYKFYYE